MPNPPLLDPVETLAQLVAVPSVNPMGRSVSGPPFGEDRLTDHLEELLGRLGLRTERQPVAPGRENLLARLDGDPPPDRGGRVVLLDAHQDTVPVEGMSIEPFVPEIRHGRLYGRGSCDTKGGMAAILAALSRLVAERPSGMPTLLVSCTVNEEYGFTGAEALTSLWESHGTTIVPCRPHAAVVAEPTGLDVVVAHKGVVRWRCHTTGRACHSARPADGVNAIYRMAPVLAAIERYCRQELDQRPVHPLCGPPTLSVGTICGGTSVNTVPDRCTIEIDHRLPPGQSPDASRQQVIDSLDQALGGSGSLQHDPLSMRGLALADEANGVVAETLAALVRATAGECRRVGVPYATNAAFYAAAGVPSVVFGPGHLDQAHTKDEWLPLDQLRQATEIFYRFCLAPEKGVSRAL
ncbi:MAG: M20 family metallopeptidase [Pirellulales bacterium]|nr:M20 family metallopeptidase [Pirellulales bacterium]